jgi:MFS family permease
LNIYGNLNDLIVNRFNIPYTTTGQLLLIPFILGSLFSLLFGKILISKPTLRRKMVLSSNIVITIAMIIFYFLPSLNPNEDIDSFTYIWVVFYLVMFSVFFGSIYTILVSSVSLLADKKRLGTAWGVVGTAIGLGQSVSPLINGLVEEDYDLKGSYKTLSLVYIFLSCFPLILSTMINFGPYNVLDNTFDGAQKSRSIE